MEFSPSDMMAGLSRNIFERACVECPTTTPSCPTCPSGQICSLTPQSCQECAKMTCVASTTTTGGGKSGPDVGAIAGGVVGGVALVALATFLIWRFFIRDRRRQQQLDEVWDDDDIATAKTQFQEQRGGAASIHTVHSVASTMLSRASNMIPIAFIPGVTNRDGTTNTPPVPPIPAARNHTPSTLSSRHGKDALFFMPNDLRNSSYSGTSTVNDRDTIYTRQSLTPSLARSSIASEVYRDDAAANPMPATTVQRLRPNMVSVKSAGSSPIELSSGTATPKATSEHDFADGKRPQVFIPGSGTVSATGSVRSNASFVRPTPVTIIKNKGRFPVRNASDASGNNSESGQQKPSISSPLAANTDSSDDDEDDDDEPHARARQSLLGPHRESATTIQDSPGGFASPFSDSVQSNSTPRAEKHMTSGGLSAVIEEATKRASRGPNYLGRETSPFGDENAAE